MFISIILHNQKDGEFVEQLLQLVRVGDNDTKADKFSEMVCMSE